jgi:SAM-dependent methyltransferase
MTTQRYFDDHARAFDRLYENRGLASRLRRGPARGRELAASVVARHAAPTVLDVGCGPGRVAEAVLDAGASAYVGIDLSPRMLELARERLERFDDVELIGGDFLRADVRGRFDVVLALGLFDYLAEPAPAAAWLHARCSSVLVASFTRRDWLKAPVRHLRYELLHGCPVFDYTEARAEALLRAAGFSGIDVPRRGRRGFLVTARAGVALSGRPRRHTIGAPAPPEVSP